FGSLLTSLVHLFYAGVVEFGRSYVFLRGGFQIGTHHGVSNARYASGDVSCRLPDSFRINWSGNWLAQNLARLVQGVVNCGRFRRGSLDRSLGLDSELFLNLPAHCFVGLPELMKRVDIGYSASYVAALKLIRDCLKHGSKHRDGFLDFIHGTGSCR